MGLLSTIASVVSPAVMSAVSNAASKASTGSTGSSGGGSSSSSPAKTTGAPALNANDQAAINALTVQYNNAQAKGDKAGMDAAHAAAEAIRARYGFSGGVDGEQYVQLPQQDQVKNFNPVVDPARATLTGGANLGNLYNITYDQQAILDKFNQATKAEYDLLRKEYRTTENKFYDNVANIQKGSLDTIRKANAQAVATGASRGIQAANELSAVLGGTQEATAGATDLANAGNLLADKQGAAMAENIVKAMTTANQVGLSLAGIDSQKYAADTQFNVGQMDYYSRLDTAIKNLEGVLAQSGAQKYTADKNLEGTQFNANKNYDASIYNSNKNYDASVYNSNNNLAGTIYNANKNLEAAGISAAAQLEGQKAIAAATTAAAQTAKAKDASVDTLALKKELDDLFYAGYKSGDYTAINMALRARMSAGEADKALKEMISSYEKAVFSKSAKPTDAGAKTSTVMAKPGTEEYSPYTVTGKKYNRFGQN